MWKGSLFSTPAPAFIVCRLLDDGHSDWCKIIYLIIVLICISLIISDTEHLFMCFLDYLYIFLGETYLDLKPIFNWIVCLFDIELNEFLYILEINPLSIAMFANIFPILWVFSFYLWIPLLCKSFWVKLGAISFCCYFHYSRRWIQKDIKDSAMTYVRVFCLGFPIRVL